MAYARRVVPFLLTKNISTTWCQNLLLSGKSDPAVAGSVHSSSVSKSPGRASPKLCSCRLPLAMLSNTVAVTLTIPALSGFVLRPIISGNEALSSQSFVRSVHGRVSERSCAVFEQGFLDIRKASASMAYRSHIQNHPTGFLHDACSKCLKRALCLRMNESCVRRGQNAYI